MGTRSVLVLAVAVLLVGVLAGPLVAQEETSATGVVRVITLKPPSDAEKVVSALEDLVAPGTKLKAVGDNRLMVSAADDKGIADVEEMIRMLAGVEEPAEASARFRVQVVRLYYLRDATAVVGILRTLSLIPTSVSVTPCGTSAIAVSADNDTDLLRMRGIIAQIDLPRPEVRLDLWGVQVSGSSPNAVSRAVAEISTLVGARRVAIHDAVQTILDAAALVRPDDRFSEALKGKEQLGYEVALTPGRVQGLFDALLFLTAAQDPAATVQSLASQLQSVTRGCVWLTQEQKDRSFERFLTSLGGAYDASAHKWVALRSGVTANRARIAFLQYAIASRAVQETPELSAEEFMASASALDEVVRTCMRALHDDVQNLYLNPLLEDLRVLARSSGNRVVGLVGNTSITTLDGSSATVSGKAMSYFDITPPTSLKEALETAETLQPQIEEYLKGADTAASSQAGTTGELIQAASGELTVAQKLAVLMAASQQRGQVWSELEDGISLTVTPHVGPNGDAAELSLYARVSREAPRVSGSADSAAKDPLNRIADHTIGKSETEQVEFRVQSLDLFPVSTFSVQTSHRRPDAEIPILGQIPYLGQIFRFKRSPAVVHHQSVLLISSTILPGASELGRLHPKGSGFSVKAFPGIPMTEGGDKLARELISEYESKAPMADSSGLQ